MHRILLALDPSSALVGRAALERDGHSVLVSPPGQIFDAILRDEFDLVIADLDGTDLSAITFSRRVDASRSAAEFILAVSESNSRSGLIAMNDGAFDFVTLPIEPERLRLMALRALERHRLRGELSATRSLLRDRYSPARWLAPAPLAHLRGEVEAILPGRAPVLLVGEPGTETAPLARLIHFWGQRSAGPFVPVPSSIFPTRELEAAMRGVARSEGSPRRRPGWFERAHGGTLFFEEISRIPLELQEWLASVIESGSVLPLGAATPLAADVRVICAIHQNPEVAEANHRFDAGLLERLRHRMIQIPPLRDRSDEIEALVAATLESCGARAVSLTSAALQWLKQQRWPGNRMELEATILRALLDRSIRDRISLADLVPGENDNSDIAALLHEEPAPGEREARKPDHHHEHEVEPEQDTHQANEAQAYEVRRTRVSHEDRQAVRGTNPAPGYRNGPVPPLPSADRPRAYAPSPTTTESRSGANGDSTGESQEHGSLHLPRNGVDLVLLERQLIEEALERTQGNQTHAARLLGLTRQTLIYRMQKYGIR